MCFLFRKPKKGCPHCGQLMTLHEPAEPELSQCDVWWCDEPPVGCGHQESALNSRM